MFKIVLLLFINTVYSAFRALTQLVGRQKSICPVKIHC